MYIYDKSIGFCTSFEEDNVINKCRDIIDTLIHVMEDKECDEIISMHTGEVISLDELRRVCGILDGLPRISLMYSTKE